MTVIPTITLHKEQGLIQTRIQIAIIIVLHQQTEIEILEVHGEEVVRVAIVAVETLQQLEVVQAIHVAAHLEDVREALLQVEAVQEVQGLRVLAVQDVEVDFFLVINYQ